MKNRDKGPQPKDCTNLKLSKKELEKALYESEERLSKFNQILTAILDHTHILAALLDPEFHFVWVNRSYADHGRRDPSYFVGKNHFDLYPDEENQRIFQNVVAKGEPFFASARPFEYPDQPERGVTYWDWSLIPVKDAAGKVNNLVFTLAEVTDRIRAEQNLRDSERRLRAIFESTEEAIVVVDEEQRCLEANPAAGAITGIPHDQLTGRFLWEFIDSGLDYSSTWASFLETGRLRGEVRVRDTDGSVHIVEAVGTANIAADRHMFVGHDITERKQAEEALRKAKDELELRVRERTAELELRNEELQEFAFVASHDLQEPLRKIQMFGDIVVSKCGESLDEQSIDFLGRMQKAAERMQALLSALLDYSRVSTKTEDFKPVELNEVAREALSNVEHLVREENGQVVIEELPVVESDRSQMVRLFQNLLSNGLKYHPPGVAPLIRVYAAHSGDGKPAETLSIIFDDNGIGFDEKYREKIFRPFERLHGRSSPYSGVGMGLSICKKIVERHGGTITAKSTPREGSTFIVSLPRVKCRRLQ